MHVLAAFFACFACQKSFNLARIRSGQWAGGRGGTGPVAVESSALDERLGLLAATEIQPWSADEEEGGLINRLT